MNYIFFPIKIKILLILLSISTTVTEIFGIGVFIPILQYMKEQGDLNALTSTSDLWQYVVNVFNWMGVEVSLVVLLSVAFFSFVVRQFLAYLRIVYRVNAVENLAKKIRTILFNRYLDADYNLYQKLNTGGLLNIITKESSQAVLGAMAPLDLFAALIMTLGYLSAMFFLSWEMTLVAVVVLVLSGLSPSRWIRQSTKTGRNLVKSNLDMSNFLVERFKSALLVRLSGTKDAEKKEFSKINFLLSRHSALKSILRGRTNVIIEPIIIGFSLMLLYFSYTALNLSIEIIGVYMLIVMRLIPVTKLIVSQFQTIKTFLGSVELINKKIWEITDSKEVDDGNKDLINFNSIEFKNVSFKFKTRKKNTLNNISFEILSGEKVAIVGPSGSGKSTIINLLPRIIKHQTGDILINGEDIGKFSLTSLRSVFSYVPQFPQIFNGTIKEHIKYGKNDAKDSEIVAVSKLVGMHNFINSLPNGYDTKVGEGAIHLSGGQRQRIDIARILMFNSPVLILDEPTSGLDIESEKKFNKTLDDIRKEKKITVIVISHRLSSIMESDLIIAIDEDGIVSKGSHQKLLSEEGWYANTWKI